MAHECPDCGEVCYCNGDIDDCLMNLDEDVYSCTHWKKCEVFDEDLYDEDVL